jgi:hypothetical protein
VLSQCCASTNRRQRQPEHLRISDISLIHPFLDIPWLATWMLTMRCVLHAQWSTVLWNFICLGLPRLGLADNSTDQVVCYLPVTTKTVANGYFPCFPNNNISSCCPTGYSCYSSPLCIITLPQAANATNPLGTTIEPACTDPLFGPGCKDYCPCKCKHVQDLFVKANMFTIVSDKELTNSLTACGNNTFCCTNAVTAGNCSCGSLAGSFSIPSGTFQTVIGFPGTPVPSTTTVQVTVTSSPSSTASSSSKLSAADIAGITIGAFAFSAISAGLFCFCLWRRRKSSKVTSYSNNPMIPQVQHITDDDPFRERIPIYMGEPRLEYLYRPEPILYTPESFTGQLTSEPPSSGRSGQKVGPSVSPDPYRRFTTRVSPPTDSSRTTELA